MAKSVSSKAHDTLGQHGALRLPGLIIDSYNLPLLEPDGEGFIGDRASQTAFRELLDARRKHHHTGDKDPFGKTPTAELSKKEIDLVLVGGDADAAHLVHAAVEDYAQRLTDVIHCFLEQPSWRKVERIVLGGWVPRQPGWRTRDSPRCPSAQACTRRRRTCPLATRQRRGWPVGLGATGTQGGT